MTAPINKLRRIVDKLQNVIDEADDREIAKVETRPNTYGLNNFVSLGSDGFLDLDDIVLVEDDK